ncbi:MAG: DUF1194 domain-containing protein [Bauldia sp.]
MSWAGWLSVSAVAVGLAGQAAADDLDVDLELTLAVDVSRSMDVAEQRLQRDGYVAAFRHPDVIRAITAGAFGRIAVSYFEWSDPGFRAPIVPWTLVASAEDAEKLAATLEAAPIRRERGTSISSGLYFAAGQFDGNGFRGLRQTVDVSGDGPNNMGYPVTSARDVLVRRGITINGLPIMLSRDGDHDDESNIPDLDLYYADCVIGGPGAFMITVDETTRFDTAIRRKLVLEISGLPPRLILAAETPAPAPRVDCLIGEKARWARLPPER